VRDVPAGSGLHAMVAEVCTSLGGWTASEAALDHEPAATAASERTLLVRRLLTTSVVRISTHFDGVWRSSSYEYNFTASLLAWVPAYTQHVCRRPPPQCDGRTS
jgi:hypothetical protein